MCELDIYQLSATIEKEDKWYVAHCMELQVTSQRKTVKDALENLKEALGLYIKHADPYELKTGCWKPLK